MSQDVVRQLNAEMAAAADQVQRSLVRIADGVRGAGAGTIWQADGLIVTNAHVIGRNVPLVTLPDGQTLPARVLAYDESLDLAALAVDAAHLPTIELGQSRQLRPGQWVLAAGHPWGVAGAVTAGVIIRVGRSPSRWHSEREYIWVAVPLRPGHSGGPLVDVHGRLVGINAMITGPEVALAVPVHVAKRFLRQALGTQQRGVVAVH